MTQSAGNIGGSAFMQIGIFSGDAPITGSYAEGGCSITRKKQVYRGICKETEFSGTIYDTEGKSGESFRFISNAELARLKRNLDGSVPASSYAGAKPLDPATVSSGVWSLGRARFLVEPRGGCGHDASLGTKSYCFNQAIDWLKCRLDKQSVDVVAMQNAWLLGSFVGRNNGQGWNIYRVAKAGDGFTAEKQRHYGTTVQILKSCIYAGVNQQAWYIGLSGQGKVAIDAASYRCVNPWAGQPIYADYLNTQDTDSSLGDIQIAYTPNQQKDSSMHRVGNSQRTSNPNGYEPAADFGGPEFREISLSRDQR